MKSKIILGIIAGALIVSLAVGGTVMLLTDTTATATNVVTLGKVEISFFENDITAGNAVKEVVSGFFEGNNYGAIAPNAVLAKAPYVTVNTGSSKAFIRVKATVTFSGSPSTDEATALNTVAAAIFADTNNSPNAAWVLVPDTDPLSAFYYYAPSGTLAEVTEGTTTATIFDTIKIPNFSTSDGLAAFAKVAGYKISLKLEAQAIQSDWNTGGNVNTSSTWPDFFVGF